MIHDLTCIEDCHFKRLLGVVGGDGGCASSANIEVEWIKIHDSWLFTGIEDCHFNKLLGMVGKAPGYVRGGIIHDSLPNVVTEASLAGYTAIEASWAI